jgi:predicted house-cleaning noncanonical NTP pyrophosphatase (MazG superfamily)
VKQDRFAPIAKGARELLDREIFGLKVAGLASVEPRWTPAYFAIARLATTDVPRVEELEHDLSRGLAGLGPCVDGVMVRSSATEESLSARGLYDSLRCAASADEVAHTLVALVGRMAEELRSGLAFLVQEWRDGAAIGHLSNERRVSRDRRGWLCEAELPVEGEDKSFRFRVDEGPAGRDDLTCTDWEELAAALRSVARLMYQTDGRFHLEWVWDGSRVWVVQCDREQVERGSRPGSAWTAPASTRMISPLRAFRDVESADPGFPKVSHVSVFRDCGLPHGDIRVLSGAEAIEALAAGIVVPDVESDLRELIRAPVVVRTDFRAATDQPALLSKRTDTCTSFAALKGFLIETSRLALESGQRAEDMAFIAHRFALARAGAFSFGRPAAPTVRIDATWGLPDGLLFHPHDSFRVDLATKKVQRYLRCKTEYIDVAGDGTWRSRPAGSPWDWNPALSDEEAGQIADMTGQLARKLGEDIGVMFFIGGTREVPWILPWFYEASHAASVDVRAARGFYVGERVTVASPEDLGVVEDILERSDRTTRFSIRLRPSVGHVRDRAFISQIAEVAKLADLLVDLEGSQLSHAYYLLQSAGVRVRCVNPWRRPARRQSFGKLVRDLVPVRIERHGELATTYPAERAELDDLVKAKVIEEAMEFFWASGRSEVVDELTDLLELLRTAARVKAVDFGEVVAAADVKKEERGGFDAGIVLVETRDPDTSTLAENGLTDQSNTRKQIGRRRSTRRVLRLPGNRLILPTAPPTGWAREETRTVTLSQDLDAAISYTTHGIQVQLRERTSTPGTEQLVLF